MPKTPSEQLEPDPQPTQPAEWLSSWIRSEAFWRDVASNAIGALVVALPVAIVVLAAAQVPLSLTLRWLTVIAIYAGLAFGLGVKLVQWSRRILSKEARSTMTPRRYAWRRRGLYFISGLVMLIPPIITTIVMLLLDLTTLDRLSVFLRWD
jgi:hypothetical protein